LPSLGVRRKHSPLNLIHCNNWAKTKPDFTRMVPFQMVSDSPDLHSRWPLLLKISFFIAYYCFISNINWSCMKIRGSTFLLSFSMKYFFQPIYSNYVNKAVFDKKKIWIFSLESIKKQPCQGRFMRVLCSYLCATASPPVQDGHCY
jgi:hypothetical protein